MKRFATLLFASVLALSMVACSKDKGEDTEKDVTDEPAAVEPADDEKEKADAPDAADYVGSWEYDGYSAGFIIAEDNTYSYVSSEGNEEGLKWEFTEDGKGISLKNAEGGEDNVLKLNKKGQLVDQDTDVLGKVTEFSFADDSAAVDGDDENAYVGTWEYYGSNGLVMIVKANGKFIDDTAVHVEGTYTMEDGYIQLLNPDGENYGTLALQENGDMVDNYGDLLFKQTTDNAADDDADDADDAADDAEDGADDSADDAADDEGDDEE